MAGVVADWRRAALVDRFLRPRLTGGQQAVPAPPVPPLGQYIRDAGAGVIGLALRRYIHDAEANDDDAGTYAAGLDGFVNDVADAYAVDPAELAAAHAPAPGPGARPTWYFVSPARRHGRAGPRCRAPSCKRCGGAALPGGEWIGQASDRHAEQGGGVRHVRRFFYVADASDPKAPAEWIMVENFITMGGGCDEELVLCELYRARRPTSVA